MSISLPRNIELRGNIHIKYQAESSQIIMTDYIESLEPVGVRKLKGTLTREPEYA